MTVLYVRGIVQPNKLVNVRVGKVFSRIPCKHGLAIGAIDLPE